MMNIFRQASTPIRALLLATLLLTALSTSAVAANIGCFGDSITRGYGSDTGGYPPKLSDLLNGNSRPAVVANFGRDGESTYEGAGRIESVLASFPAHLMLIQEGTNDVIIGVSSYTSAYNLQTIVSKVKSAGVTPLLATLPSCDRNGGQTLIPNEWNPMIKGLASSNKIVVVDIYAATLPSWSDNFPDGVHPNDTGYQIMANTWFATLSGMISSSGDIRGSGGGGGGSSSCFIATAAFGSPMQPHVALLRKFRDMVLLPSDLGKRFVAAYYHYSPPAAQFISRHEELKPLVRMALYPLIGMAWLILSLSPTAAALLALIGGGSVVMVAMAAGKRRRSTPV